jgi:hypothetical protein
MFIYDTKKEEINQIEINVLSQVNARWIKSILEFSGTLSTEIDSRKALSNCSHDLWEKLGGFDKKLAGAKIPIPIIDSTKKS